MTTYHLTCYAIFLLCLLPFSTSTLWQRQQNHVVNVPIDPELQLPRDQEQASSSRRYLQSVPQHTHYTVRFIDRPTEHFTSPQTSPAEVHIKIVNPNPESWYTVTVLSTDYYTGSAKYIKTVINRPGNPLLYSWTPLTRGEYEIIVHELPNSVEQMVPTPPMGESYKFTVVDLPGIDTIKNMMSNIKWWPPCSKLNDMRLYSHWDGNWIGPRLHGGIAGLRTGWYFLPSKEMQCKFEYFTHQELSFMTEEKSIYILGNREERGIFLSLVDMLLEQEEKEHLNESVIAKCWGRAFVVKSNLKVMYQDWRAWYFQEDGEETGVLCHNDRVVRESGKTYTENGLKVWNEIFFDNNKWPEVILMQANANRYDLKHFLSSIPAKWDGTLFLMDELFSAMHLGRGSEGEHEFYRQSIREMVLGFHDPRVKWLDGMGLSRDMRFHSESGPDHISFSQHFHSHCNELYIDENNQHKTMKICSNITEVVGQVLLSHALGPKEDFFERAKQFSSYYRGRREAMYCHSCPAELLPFHITPYPDMQCSTGPLHPRTEYEKDSFPALCPAKCNELPATRIAQTQSGVVEERNCPLEYFTSDDTNNDDLVGESSYINVEVRMVDFDPPVPVEANFTLRRNDGGTERISTSSSLGMMDLIAVMVVVVIYQSKIRKLLRAAASKLDDLRSRSLILGSKSLKKVAFGAGTLAMIFAASLLNSSDNDRSSNDTTKHVNSGSEAETSNLVWNRSAALVTSGKLHDNP